MSTKNRGGREGEAVLKNEQERTSMSGIAPDVAMLSELCNEKRRERMAVSASSASAKKKGSAGKRRVTVVSLLAYLAGRARTARVLSFGGAIGANAEAPATSASKRAAICSEKERNGTTKKNRPARERVS